MSEASRPRTVRPRRGLDEPRCDRARARPSITAFADVLLTMLSSAFTPIAAFGRRTRGGPSRSPSDNNVAGAWQKVMVLLPRAAWRRRPRAVMWQAAGQALNPRHCCIWHEDCGTFCWV